MENASKALIIAGAILLSILLISLGMMVYNQASSVLNTNAMDDVAISAFNNPFEAYSGPNVTGTSVNSLMSKIYQNNRTNADDASRQITVALYPNSGTDTGTDTGWSTTGTLPSGVQTTASGMATAQTGIAFSVYFGYDANSGFINKVTITKK